MEKIATSTYDFSIQQIIREAWSYVSGCKLAFFLSHLLNFCLLLALFLLMALLFLANQSIAVLIYLISIFIFNVIGLGFIPITLKHLNGKPVKVIEDFFSTLNRFGILFVTNILLPLIIYVSAIVIFLIMGFIAGIIGQHNLIFIALPICILSMLFLSIAFILVNWIILDYPEAKIWLAIHTSFIIVKQHWFKFFWLLCFILLINTLASLPLGIGLIWSIPFSYLIIGCTYKHIFHIQIKTEDNII
ncbi:hypothetical protein PT286_00440 [Neisseriaceae bacterium ESL0693]|nr:hypothetical protein [Neisseriaceae bacterium ESL0693]